MNATANHKFPNEHSDVIFIHIDQHLKMLLKKYKAVPILLNTVHIYIFGLLHQYWGLFSVLAAILFHPANIFTSEGTWSKHMLIIKLYTSERIVYSVQHGAGGVVGVAYSVASGERNFIKLKLIRQLPLRGRAYNR